MKERSAEAASPVEQVQNESGYKVAAEEERTEVEQGEALDDIEATRVQVNIAATAYEEKVEALARDGKRRGKQEGATAKAQKAEDDIAVQCWLRHKLAE
ncbi:hypothetical protein [Escherichia coli]|uniref:hypothetical protein n=1 Tax=Escherichia coli TaxID=562 RepID=UPI00098AF33C|nr:hypothetical protein [Escherichia coli]